MKHALNCQDDHEQHGDSFYRCNYRVTSRRMSAQKIYPVLDHFAWSRMMARSESKKILDCSTLLKTLPRKLKYRPIHLIGLFNVFTMYMYMFETCSRSIMYRRISPSVSDKNRVSSKVFSSLATFTRFTILHL